MAIIQGCRKASSVVRPNRQFIQKEHPVVRERHPPGRGLLPPPATRSRDGVVRALNGLRVMSFPLPSPLALDLRTSCVPPRERRKYSGILRQHGLPGPGRSAQHRA